MDCTCGGMNPTCFRCGGSGSLNGRDAVAPRKRTRYHPVVPVVPRPQCCPICGVAVSKLQKHLRKVHGGVASPLPDANAALGSCPLSENKEPVVGPTIATRLAQKPLAPITSCNVCGVKVRADRLSRHLSRAHSAARPSPADISAVSALKIGKYRIVEGEKKIATGRQRKVVHSAAIPSSLGSENISTMSGSGVNTASVRTRRRAGLTTGLVANVSHLGRRT
jgi:hypothetical protein